MNLISHLLKKDIRRSRVLLIVWLILLVLQCVLISSSANPADRVMQALYTMISVIVPLLQALLLLVIVPFVVHEEPLVGTTAFWLTRPLSGRLLLKSKALFLAAVLILPALLLEIVVLAANGLRFHDLMLAAPEIVMNQLSLIAAIAIVAALTPTFGRYAIVGVIALVVWVAASLILQWMRLFFDPQYFMSMGQNISLGRSSGVVFSLMMIFVAGAVVAHQYLSRRTLRSIIAASIGIIAIFGVQSLWKWDFLARHIPSSGNPPFDVSAVKIDHLKSVYVSEIGSARGAGAPVKDVRAEVIVTGVPEAFLVRSEHIRASLKSPDGAQIATKELRATSLTTQAYEKALSSALGGVSIVNAEKWSTSDSLFMLDAADYNKYHTQPLALAADFDFIIYKYSVTEEMPAVKGARFDQGSRHAAITEVLRQPDGIDIGLRERSPNLIFDRGNTHQPAVDPGFWHFYLLLSKKRNEAVLQKRDNLGSYVEMVRGQSILVNQSQQLSFGPEPNYHRVVPDFTPEWLADAELVRVDLVPVYKILSKRLVVEKFVIDEKKAGSNVTE